MCFELISMKNLKNFKNLKKADRYLYVLYIYVFFDCKIIYVHVYILYDKKSILCVFVISNMLQTAIEVIMFIL